MKSIFVKSNSINGYDHLVDGHLLAQDTETALNRLERDGYEVVSVVPIIGGRYDFQRFDGRTQGMFNQKTVSPDTCASWGYSMTDGVMIVARPRKA